MASGGLFLAAGAAALALPAGPGGAARAGAPWHGFAALVALPRFRRTVLVAALVIGAHAMHDGFAMILWRSAGIAATTAGLLWSVSVAAEVLVFLLVGPPLLARIGPATGIAVAACAGGLRWAVLASTTALPWLAAAESLHGLSFALLHLACLGSSRRRRRPISGRPRWRSTARWASACRASPRPWPPGRSTGRSALRPSGPWRR